MSQYPGFPFLLKCDSKEKVKMKASSGYLFDLTGELEDYSIACGKTVYWNNMGEMNIEDKVQIDFTLGSNTQSYTLSQNGFEYILES